MYESTSATAAHPDPTRDIAHGLAARLRERFKSSDFTPPTLPEAALRLLAMARDSAEVSIPNVVSLLESDPVLAARVFQIAQSPLYGTGAPLRSLRAAVVRLGLNTLRNIILEVGLNMRVFNHKEFARTMASLQRHSQVTAYAMRKLSRHIGLDPEFAFLCGLMHDVGIAGALLEVAEWSAEERDAYGDPETFTQAIAEIHEEVGGVLARAWGLPFEVEMVVSNHHVPISGVKSTCPITAVCVTEHLATICGAPIENLGGHARFEYTSPALFHEACWALGLSEEDLSAFEDDVQAIASAIA